MVVTAILRAGLVTLAPLQPEDVNAIYLSWLADPVVTRFTEITAPGDEASVRFYVAQAIAASDAAIWRINYSGSHVGNIRLSRVNRRHSRAELALLVGERAVWGKGIGTTAVRLLADHAFAAYELHKLVAGIYAGNEGSCRVFEKAGFHREAVLRNHALFEGAYVDVVQMARFTEARA